jgi:hypothetical protein
LRKQGGSPENQRRRPSVAKRRLSGKALETLSGSADNLIDGLVFPYSPARIGMNV